MPFYEYRRLSPEEQRALVQERRARGFPPHRPPHLDQGPGYYLLTAAVYEHARLIAPEPRRTAFQAALLEAFGDSPVEAVAWVVLPNHYHMLVWLPALALVPAIVRHLHGRSARQWNVEDQMPGRRVWYHYSDRAIRAEAQFFRAINYIHANPVRHSYVARSREWRWSSLPRYLETVGEAWLADTWSRFPAGDFGAGWDDAGV